MNKLVASLALAASTLLPSCTQAQTDAVVVTGQLKGLGDSLIITDNPHQPEKALKIATPDGKLNFTYPLTQPTMLNLSCPETIPGGQRRISFQMVGVPGETAELSGDANGSLNFTGSKFYKEFDEACRAIEAAGKERKAWMESLEQRMAAGESQESIMKEYRAKEPEFKKQRTEQILAFIQQHPDYEACATLVMSLEKLDDIRKAITLLSPNVRDGRMKNLYQSYLDYMVEQAKADSIAAAKQAPGAEAPDFTLNDINGKPLTLSSLRGQYVILDFWGSWCVWCIKGFPEMKNYYEKYKGKFEILGVDCRDTEEKWKTAVERNALPWLHVYCPRDNGKVLNDYAIQGFPTKIIIDPQGKIVKTIVGEDPQFYTLLDELFGAN